MVNNRFTDVNNKYVHKISKLIVYNSQMTENKLASTEIQCKIENLFIRYSGFCCYKTAICAGIWANDD